MSLPREAAVEWAITSLAARVSPIIGAERNSTILDVWSANRKLARNASAVSDAPDYRTQVGTPRCAGRVRYSCLKEAARGEALMQIQWCWGGKKSIG